MLQPTMDLSEHHFRQARRAGPPLAARVRACAAARQGHSQSAEAARGVTRVYRCAASSSGVTSAARTAPAATAACTAAAASAISWRDLRRRCRRQLG